MQTGSQSGLDHYLSNERLPAAAGANELNARDAYRAALVAASASLRRAEELFEAAAASIDAHIARSFAADVAVALSAAPSRLAG
jgi:hypothetical protein